MHKVLEEEEAQEEQTPLYTICLRNCLRNFLGCRCTIHQLVICDPSHTQFLDASRSILEQVLLEEAQEEQTQRLRQSE